MTNGKGWGVRPMRDLPAGAFVAECVSIIDSLHEYLVKTDQSNTKTFKFIIYHQLINYLLAELWNIK